MASAGKKYLCRYGVLPGKSVVLFTNNDHAYLSAFEFANKGAKVTIIDSRNEASETVMHKCAELKIEIHPSHSIISTFGQKKVNAIEIQKTEDQGNKLIGSSKKIDVDLLLMSGGWNPAVQLFLSLIHI